jgi:hypothetical protein
VRSSFFLLFEQLVVFDQVFYAAHRKYGRVFLSVRFQIVVVDDIIHDLLQAIGGIEHFLGVDVFYLDVNEGIAFLFVAAQVFDTEAQHVLIADGIGDHVLVEALTKQIFGCAFAQLHFLPHCLQRSVCL